MIDYQTYRKMHPESSHFYTSTVADSESRSSFDEWPDHLQLDAEIEDEKLFMLLPPHIHAFYLNEKKWSK